MQTLISRSIKHLNPVFIHDTECVSGIHSLPDDPIDGENSYLYPLNLAKTIGGQCQTMANRAYIDCNPLKPLRIGIIATIS